MDSQPYDNSKNIYYLFLKGWGCYYDWKFKWALSSKTFVWFGEIHLKVNVGSGFVKLSFWPIPKRNLNELNQMSTN